MFIYAIFLLLSMSSLWCIASFFVINFLVLVSLHLSFSLVYFKNGFKYLTSGGDAQVIKPLVEIFAVMLIFEELFRSFEEFFSYFSFIPSYLIGSEINTSKHLLFSFYKSVLTLCLIKQFYFIRYFSFSTYHHDNGSSYILLPNQTNSKMYSSLEVTGG